MVGAKHDPTTANANYDMIWIVSGDEMKVE